MLRGLTRKLSLDCCRQRLEGLLVFDGSSVAIALAEMLASRPALALSLIRAGVRDSLNQTTQEAIDRTLADSHRVFTGPDIEEGVKAFFAKRAPVFTAARGIRRENAAGD